MNLFLKLITPFNERNKMVIRKKKMKESELVKFMKDEVERVTGLKCKVVPESNTWYDGICLDTGNLGLHMFLLKDLEEHYSGPHK